MEANRLTGFSRVVKWKQYELPGLKDDFWQTYIKMSFEHYPAVNFNLNAVCCPLASLWCNTDFFTVQAVAPEM